MAITDKMDKNIRLFVRVVDLGYTDKCSKKRLLSVNPHNNGQKFTDKSLENAGLSVNLNEILDKLVEQYCI